MWATELENEVQVRVLGSALEREGVKEKLGEGKTLAVKKF